MSERKKEMRVFKIDYVCDECGVGTMSPFGNEMLSRPPQMDHVCSHCGAIKRFRAPYYPRIVREER